MQKDKSSSCQALQPASLEEQYEDQLCTCIGSISGSRECLPPFKIPSAEPAKATAKVTHSTALFQTSCEKRTVLPNSTCCFESDPLLHAHLLHTPTWTSALLQATDRTRLGPATTNTGLWMHAKSNNKDVWSEQACCSPVYPWPPVQVDSGV